MSGWLTSFAIAYLGLATERIFLPLLRLVLPEDGELHPPSFTTHVKVQMGGAPAALEAYRAGDHLLAPPTFRVLEELCGFSTAADACAVCHDALDEKAPPERHVATLFDEVHAFVGYSLTSGGEAHAFVWSAARGMVESRDWLVPPLPRGLTSTATAAPSSTRASRSRCPARSGRSRSTWCRG